MKLKKKFIKMPVEEESTYSYDELKEKLDGIIESQADMQLYKQKGKPIFLWSKRKNEDEYELKYYHSYKTDMCDNMLVIGIKRGLERSNVTGFVCKPRGIWATFWGIVASPIIDFLILSYCFLFVAGFNLMDGLAVSAAALIVRAYLCFSLLEINRDRANKLKEELLNVIRKPYGDDEDTETEEAEE